MISTSASVGSSHSTEETPLIGQTPRTTFWGMRGFKTLLLGVLLLLPGCSSPEHPASSILVQDSAGIRIVENSLAAMDSAPEWALSPSPTLKLGALDGADPFLFHRVNGAVLHNGLIWVLDGGSSELRAFRLDGSHVQTAGRSGEGPGEFVFPVELVPLGPDTLMVWDRQTQRISFFGPNGTFLRSISILNDFQGPSFVSAFDDGSFLFSDLRAVFPRTGVVEESPLFIVRFDSHGLLTDSLGVFPWVRMKRVERPRDFAAVTFSPVTFVSGDRRTFWVGTGEDLEIQERKPNGDLIQIVRWQAPDRRVRKEQVEAWYSEQLERAETEEARSRIRQRREQVPVADKFPALADLVVDRVGRLWVKEYQGPLGEGTNRWMVFSGNGEIAARIRLQRGFWPLEFGENYVLGFTRGEFDEEYVVLFDLEMAEVGP